MSAIRTNAAANLLGVSASTLRSWERRYQFPRPGRSTGGHRQYELSEVEALRQALGYTRNISSAVAVARERGAAPSGCAELVTAFLGFADDAVSRVLEESLALRSVERTLEDLLLPAVEALALDPGSATPEYEYAYGHATVWLSALKRLGAAAVRPEGVLIFDGAESGSVDALHAFALELVVRRAGLRTLTLTPAIDPTRLGRAIRALCPGAVVLTGAGACLDSVGRLVFAVRSQVSEVEVFDYRGAIPDTGASTVTRLGEHPVAAGQQLLAALSGHSAGHTLMAGHVTASPFG